MNEYGILYIIYMASSDQRYPHHGEAYTILHSLEQQQF